MHGTFAHFAAYTIFAIGFACWCVRYLNINPMEGVRPSVQENPANHRRATQVEVQLASEQALSQQCGAVENANAASAGVVTRNICRCAM